MFAGVVSKIPQGFYSLVITEVLCRLSKLVKKERFVKLKGRMSFYWTVEKFQEVWRSFH